MGGSGNSSRSPSQGEGVKPTAAPVGEKDTDREREPRGEGGSKKPELHESQDTKDRKQKELEQKRAIKAMSSAKRVEHFASKTMLGRATAKAFKAWTKAGEKGGYQKGYVEGVLKGIKAGWNKGGKSKWVKSNKKAAQIIRAKAAREEAWRKNPGQFSV